MRKKVGILKRMLCLLLIFLLSINSFAAIVSDNDGSAFITKAEFDALKSSFQSQIDSYNQSIDSKIDGAIASYLAGISVATKVEQPILFPRAATEGVTCFNYNGWFSARDVLGLPFAELRMAEGKMEQSNKFATIYTMTSTFELGKRIGLDTVEKNTDNFYVGSWFGFVSDVKDNLSLFMDSIHNSGNWGNASAGDMAYGGFNGRIESNKDAGQGKTVLEVGGLAAGPIWWKRYYDTTTWVMPAGSDQNRYTQTVATTVTGASQTHGTVDKPLLCLEKTLEYVRFSDFGNPTRWCGTSGDSDAYWEATDNATVAWFSDKDCGNTQVWSGSTATNAPTMIHVGSFATALSSHRHYKPLFGIMGSRITGGVKNWKNVYEIDFDGLWDPTWETTYASSEIKKFGLKDGKGKFHLSLNAGFPLVQVKKDKKYEITLTADVTSQWRLWISLGPFHNGDSDLSVNYNPIDLTSHTRDSSKGNAYILNKTDTIKFVAPNDGIVFLKWKGVLNDFTSDDSCVMKPDSKIIMINES